MADRMTRSMATRKAALLFCSLLLTCATAQARQPVVGENKLSCGSAEGEAAVAKLVKALGGEAKLNPVKTLHLDLTMTKRNVEIKADLLKSSVPIAAHLLAPNAIASPTGR